MTLDAARLDACLAAIDALHYRCDAVEFRESEHPRENDGKFTSGAGSSSTGRDKGHLAVSEVNGERRAPDGGPLPAHIVKLRIPPVWRDVTYASDADADLLATGRDAKGRLQAVYSQRFAATQAAAKFARIKELDDKFTQVRQQNEAARKSDNPRTRDSADALKVIMETGIRPGSETDTKASVKAYGATTLEGKHVVVDGNPVSLRFVGKKGVSLDIPVRDASTAAMLRQRAKKAGPDGKLFPATNHAALLAHTHSLDGGSFKTKDFRTLLGTQEAMREVRLMPKPSSESAYKKAVMAVAKKVSARLGNTPTVALQSYINPSVFAGWRMGE